MPIQHKQSEWNACQQTCVHIMVTCSHIQSLSLAYARVAAHKVGAATSQCVETLVCAAKIAIVVNVPAVARKKWRINLERTGFSRASSLDKVQEQLIEGKMMFASEGLL